MANNKLMKWALVGIGILLLLYVGSIVYFEARLGYLQPQGSTSLLLATFDSNDKRHERVLRLEQMDGKHYIAVNHWPRRWYRHALGNPNVEAKMPGEENFRPFQAIPLDGEELRRISEQYSVGLNFRIRTGFPPRRFLRLDPA
ncbi:MAG: hypothetical protein OXE78_04200 [Gammaproteobacteria bacterium]|nr:hypothetical protein [Gammaproteobacteria bacterium]